MRSSETLALVQAQPLDVYVKLAKERLFQTQRDQLALLAHKTRTSLNGVNVLNATTTQESNRALMV
jgi:hypothetical protein